MCTAPTNARRKAARPGRSELRRAPAGPLLLDELGVRALLAALDVEVLQLGEVSPLRYELLQRGRVLADAVPAARGVVVHHELVQQGLRHHRRWTLVRIETEFVAFG